MAVAKIGDTYFANLQDALDVVQEGETIEVLADIPGDEGAAVYTYDGDAAFTLDLGGKSMADRLTINSGTATIQNGTINGRLDAYDSSTVTQIGRAHV